MCAAGPSILRRNSVSNHLRSLFLCLYFLFPAYYAMGSNNCTHYYLTQPVRAITCNPYHPLNAELCLECNTFGVGDYNIFWFHSIEGTVTQQLADGQDGIDIDLNVIADFQHSELRIPNPQYNNVGYYWCQIGLLERNNLTVTVNFLEQSQRILLLPVDNYTGLPPCARQGEHDEPTARCATDPPPDLEDVQMPSKIPSWSYGLFAELAIAHTVIAILLLVNLAACRKLKKTKNGLHQLKAKATCTEKAQQKSDLTHNPQPPVPRQVLQVSSHTSAPPKQTLHVVPPPADKELMDRCNVMYDEAGNESTRPNDMPYKLLDHRSMDDPTIYTPPVKYQQLNLQSVNEAHAYSSIQ